MASSLITRCPKCSTAFRVTDDVLSMAKGKVRCGQCFHIFNAVNTDAPLVKAEAPRKKVQNASTQTETTLPKNERKDPQNKPSSKAIFTGISDTVGIHSDETINPDWLETLFDGDDLTPVTDFTPTTPDYLEKESPAFSANHRSRDTLEKNIRTSTAAVNTDSKNNEANSDQAPWEVELAEVEAALKETHFFEPTTQSKHHPRESNKSDQLHKTPQYVLTKPEKEPDYMTALHTLAQTAAEQASSPEQSNQHRFLEQLSAQQNLAPLIEDHAHPNEGKKNHLWAWFVASLLAASLLIAQVAVHFFDEGSRSSNFRHFYRAVCSYTSCVLPRFEDVSAISLQHVRIQSHPSLDNSLLVNAIMTNNSRFSQPMPKIALEFYDLNGAPVAARLFSPSDYLHRDFLDITFMPPETPIHLVIPIQDPSARAVTHQLKAFPADTRSY